MSTPKHEYKGEPNDELKTLTLLTRQEAKRFVAREPKLTTISYDPDLDAIEVIVWKSVSIAEKFIELSIAQKYIELTTHPTRLYPWSRKTMKDLLAAPRTELPTKQSDGIHIKTADGQPVDFTVSEAYGAVPVNPDSPADLDVDDPEAVLAYAANTLIMIEDALHEHDKKKRDSK